MLHELGVEAEVRIVKTSGDMFLDRPLHQLKGQGLFVREIDERMLAGEVDLAVHSMKDLPTKRPPQLAISAILERDSPHDILVTPDGLSLEELPGEAVVGTSSLRRAAQLRRARPDLRVKSLRGNLQTRLSKLASEECQAIVIAEAGVQRMGYELAYSVLDVERFVPSANQGTIVVVGVDKSPGHLEAKRIDHPATRAETMVERRIMEVVGGGCVVPMAVHAQAKRGGMRVLAEVLSLDGTRYVRVDEVIAAGDVQEAEIVGQRLVEMGGQKLVEEAVRSAR
ncbi:MAG TPA: hydroxymethylbilane synthase [Methanotrichaceae archaeon]|nr:hydroxymethylbilane synthase [Methanotrichaceae archaeon]HQF15855.1 hydroxymethylbilane synthase [Methanotrichaceae archaeon]HQI90469.1 hydroxymethylbilane synthase [Methanotrichaceae archaeon]HQJ28142.1 hydroxymethylbilane synthase [Methanotrichaceae archaeon]